MARGGAGVVLMHMRGDPTTMGSTGRPTRRGPRTWPPSSAVAVARAREAGIADDAIVVDPGIGFAKDAEHSLALLADLGPVLALGFPVLVGPSRKRFLGSVLDVPPGERLAGTLAACVAAYFGGARIFRVHDVRPAAQALAVAHAIAGAGSGPHREDARRVSRIWEELQFLKPGWTDLVEILIVAFLLYRILLVIQRTRAMQILLGLVLLAFGYGMSRLLDLILIRTILEKFFQYGAIAALVVFQPELRAALARLGRSRMMKVFQRLEGSRVADEIVEAVQRLSRARIGAIIAVEQDVGLDEYAETGSAVRRPGLRGDDHHDLHAVLAAPRRGDPHQRRRHPHGGGHPAADAVVGFGPLPGHPAPRGARAQRGDRRRRHRRERGDRAGLPGPGGTPGARRGARTACARFWRVRSRTRTPRWPRCPRSRESRGPRRRITRESAALTRSSGRP